MRQHSWRQSETEIVVLMLRSSPPHPAPQARAHRAGLVDDAVHSCCRNRRDPPRRVERGLIAPTFVRSGSMSHVPAAPRRIIPSLLPALHASAASVRNSRPFGSCCPSGGPRWPWGGVPRSVRSAASPRLYECCRRDGPDGKQEQIHDQHRPSRRQSRAVEGLRADQGWRARVSKVCAIILVPLAVSRRAEGPTTLKWSAFSRCGRPGRAGDETRS